MKGWKLFTPLLILAIVAITLYLRLHNPPLLLQGEADATNVIVSSKAKGRVQVLHVRRGDEVKQGDLLISLDSPELDELSQEFQNNSKTRCVGATRMPPPTVKFNEGNL